MDEMNTSPPASPPAPPEGSTLPTAVCAAIEALYAEVEAELARYGPLCWRRGHCCDFPRAGHDLFATDLEALYLLARHPDPAAAAGGEPELCPFWRAGRCHARETRPLGCRTYFCAGGWEHVGATIHERFHRRLVAIGERNGVPYRYASWPQRLRELVEAEGTTTGATPGALSGSLDRPRGAP